jgi:hypothetical protein
MRRLSSVSLQLAGTLLAVGLALSPAHAQTFEFKSAPSTASNTIYRVNTVTGEMGACAYGTGGAIGITQCYPAGEGGGIQPPGSYHLIGSNMATEQGLYRVNQVTGEMSVCYVSNSTVVCTAAAK